MRADDCSSAFLDQNQGQNRASLVCSPTRVPRLSLENRLDKRYILSIQLIDGDHPVVDLFTVPH